MTSPSKKKSSFPVELLKAWTCFLVTSLATNGPHYRSKLHPRYSIIPYATVRPRAVEVSRSIRFLLRYGKRWIGLSTVKLVFRQPSICAHVVHASGQHHDTPRCNPLGRTISCVRRRRRQTRGSHYSQLQRPMVARRLPKT